MTRSFLLSLLLLHLLLASQPCEGRSLQAKPALRGSWQLLHKNIGIAAMHMQLLNNDRVVIYDRTDYGETQIPLPPGVCRYDPGIKRTDCTAHSVEYDVSTNTVRPLFVQSNVWCSSGAAVSDGRLVQAGGNNDGVRKVRSFTPCGTCDWVEEDNVLGAPRWYATTHLLPDGRQIIIGGRRQFNYEFYPKNVAPNVYNLPFLAQTNDRNIENNLYPFVFLNVDGNLFIFANNRAILLDYVNHKVVRTYPAIPGGEPRNYPSTGSAVLLPLKSLQAKNIQAEVLICGGAPNGSFSQAIKGNFVKPLDTCARMTITDPNPVWIMETMPMPRVMNDMTLLPNGHVLILNGAGAGTAGWELGRAPVLNPVLYQPDMKNGSRFETLSPSTIPRMYHSTMSLLRDGRVLVGGSDPHRTYNFTAEFPTELRLEAFSPPYLDARHDSVRPTIVSLSSNIHYGQKLVVRFHVRGKLIRDVVRVTMLAPSFTTHSFSMSHRLLDLGNEGVTNAGNNTYDIQVTAPSSGVIAPSAYYMLFVVHYWLPSPGAWVHIG